MPPLAFLPILSILALALGWRAGLGLFALPPGLSGFLDGVAAAVFLFAAAGYLRKLSLRPAVLAEERADLPGRLGGGAASLSILLFAALLSPYAGMTARAFLVAGLAVAGMLLLHVLRVWAGRARLRGHGGPDAPISAPVDAPGGHLDWVALLLGAAVAPTLGWPWLGALLIWPGVAVTLLIWGLSLWRLRVAPVPAPLRPLLALHLLPVPLIGLAALATGHEGLARLCAVLSGALLLAGLVGARWLLRPGSGLFRPVLCLPVVFAALLLCQIQPHLGGEAARILAGSALIAATLITVPVTFLVLRDWARGRLAVRSNAAIA